ncbi:MAG: galactose mutarotase [Parasporobacterium sp.]|nr:galactose mutarotase [Parasporobacterium sp.]
MNSYEFGKTSDGRTVNAYIIENINGIRVEFLDFGCILRQFWVPKADDSYVNIVHGLDSVAEYEADTCCFGAFVGRFANRIKDSEFLLGDQRIRLTPNDGPNHLHGVWCKKIFDAAPLPAKTLEESSKGIVFTYHSPDGEDGFPGGVDVKVTYVLDDENVLHMDYEAVPDQDTVMNLTNHSYFHLGAGQTVQVNADRYLETDSAVIPTGRILSVEDPEVMDLREGKDVELSCPDSGCFDHCFILNRDTEFDPQAPLRIPEQPDVVLHAPGRGITLEIRTSEPSVQIYSGNSAGVAVEPQMYPCAPNFPEFPSCLVKKGQRKRCTSLYRIRVSDEIR